jgi:hypothetical protein
MNQRQLTSIMGNRKPENTRGEGKSARCKVFAKADNARNNKRLRTACGTQYPESADPPSHCVICEEERQYVPPRGQTWTTLESLRVGHANSFREYETGLIGIGTQPQFAIGQRALLVRTPGGNVLWDCISLLNAATVTMINSLGGLKAIAISHPHFYTTMFE